MFGVEKARSKQHNVKPLDQEKFQWDTWRFCITGTVLTGFIGGYFGSLSPGVIFSNSLSTNSPFHVHRQTFLPAGTKAASRSNAGFFDAVFRPWIYCFSQHDGGIMHIVMRNYIRVPIQTS